MTSLTTFAVLDGNSLAVAVSDDGCLVGVASDCLVAAVSDDRYLVDVAVSDCLVGVAIVSDDGSLVSLYWLLNSLSLHFSAWSRDLDRFAGHLDRRCRICLRCRSANKLLGP